MHSPMFTLEVFPPKRTRLSAPLYDTLDGLERLNPDFHLRDLRSRHPFRPHRHRAHRPHDQQEYGIPAVAHLTALYSDKAKIDEALDMFEEAA